MLRKGITTCCGNWRVHRQENFSDLTGTKVGRLTVIKEYTGDKPYKTRKVRWECLCDCGESTIVAGWALRSGDITSCGCRQKEICREIGIKSTKYSEEDVPVISLMKKYETGAYNRGLEFNLSKEECSYFFKGNCYYCGVAPSRIHKCPRKTRSIPDYMFNGIDRMDNSQGYSVSNCVSCCFECNRAKMDRNSDEFLEWVKRVFENRSMK